jgi:hypothetical protein
MAAIVTGTVVLWRVVNRGEPNERVQHVSDRPVSVYVAGDDDAELDETATIISQYILDAIEWAKKKGADEKAQLAIALKLLKKRVNGLLQVVGTRRESVKPPLVSDESDESVSDESDEGKRRRRTKSDK